MPSEGRMHTPNGGFYRRSLCVSMGAWRGRGAAGERLLFSRVARPRGCPEPLHGRARVLWRCRERMDRDVPVSYALRTTPAKGVGKRRARPRAGHDATEFGLCPRAIRHTFAARNVGEVPQHGAGCGHRGARRPRRGVVDRPPGRLTYSLPERSRTKQAKGRHPEGSRPPDHPPNRATLGVACEPCGARCCRPRSRPPRS